LRSRKPLTTFGLSLVFWRRRHGTPLAQSEEGWGVAAGEQFNQGGSVKLNRSWLSLLTFCASASLAAALALALIFAGASAVVAAAGPAAPEPTFSGVITDSQCGARHAEDSGKSPAECTLACIRNGAKYALVNGDRKYVLDGNPDELSHWAGQRATIAGIRSGDTIKVTSIDSPR
jgi:hypothetical protein